MTNRTEVSTCRIAIVDDSEINLRPGEEARFLRAVPVPGCANGTGLVFRECAGSGHRRLHDARLRAVAGREGAGADDHSQRRQGRALRSPGKGRDGFPDQASSRKKLADKAAWLAEEVEKATAAVYLREQERLFRMSRAAEFRDPETGAHIQRMANYSSLIARQFGLPEAELKLILHAAPMHDVDKIGIPDQILLMPGR